MSDFFETALAVQLGMQMANQQSYQKIEPFPYDDRELAPQIDPSLTGYEYLMALTDWLVTKKKPEDYPLKKDRKSR